MALFESLLPQQQQLGSSAVYFALFSALVFVGLYSLNALISVPYPKGVPLLREPPGATRFTLKTRLAYYTDCPSLYREAWENVSDDLQDLDFRGSILFNGPMLTLS